MTRFDGASVVKDDDEEYIWLIGRVWTADVPSSGFSTE